MSAIALMRARRAAMQPEPPVPDEHCWPAPAHPWFGGALPLCTMTLCPSADRAMLERALGAREQG